MKEIFSLLCVLYELSEKGMKFNMELKINIELMKDIYGEEIEKIIENNMENIKKNEKILEELKFESIQGIFEMYPELFMNFPKQFRKKIEGLKEIYGESYVKIIEEDLTKVEVLEK